MNLTIWHYIGIIILSLDILWIVLYYNYATVKVYNFYEKNKYQYLGYLWIRKKRGEWYLNIPKEMIEESLTTKYKIISQSMFRQFIKGEKIYIIFADKYYTRTRMADEFIVENYIVTSHQL